MMSLEANVAQVESSEVETYQSELSIDAAKNVETEVVHTFKVGKTIKLNISSAEKADEITEEDHIDSPTVSVDTSTIDSTFSSFDIGINMNANAATTTESLLVENSSEVSIATSTDESIEIDNQLDVDISANLNDRWVEIEKHEVDELGTIEIEANIAVDTTSISSNTAVEAETNCNSSFSVDETVREAITFTNNEVDYFISSDEAVTTPSVETVKDSEIHMDSSNSTFADDDVDLVSSENVDTEGVIENNTVNGGYVDTDGSSEEEMPTTLDSYAIEVDITSNETVTTVKSNTANVDISSALHTSSKISPITVDSTDDSATVETQCVENVGVNASFELNIDTSSTVNIDHASGHSESIIVDYQDVSTIDAGVDTSITSVLDTPSTNVDCESYVESNTVKEDLSSEKPHSDVKDNTVNMDDIRSESPVEASKTNTAEISIEKEQTEINPSHVDPHSLDINTGAPDIGTNDIDVTTNTSNYEIKTTEQVPASSAENPVVVISSQIEASSLEITHVEKVSSEFTAGVISVDSSHDENLETTVEAISVDSSRDENLETTVEAISVDSSHDETLETTVKASSVESAHVEKPSSETHVSCTIEASRVEANEETPILKRQVSVVERCTDNEVETLDSFWSF